MQRATQLSPALRYLSILGVILVASMASAAGHPKLSRELAGVAKGQPVKVIVQYHAPTESDFARAQTRAKDGMPPKRLSLIKSASLTVDSGSLSDFENDANVAHVSIDHQVFETEVPPFAVPIPM